MIKELIKKMGDMDDVWQQRESYVIAKYIRASKGCDKSNKRKERRQEERSILVGDD